MLISFSEYYNDPVITEEAILEELHPDLKAVLDYEAPSAHQRFQHLTKAVRGVIKQGGETGLEGDKPKKGSSRAVYFPKDHHTITLDGKEAKIPSVLKIAFHGQLDKYNKTGKLLGEHQNEAEADHFTNRSYGIIKATNHNWEGQPTHFETNHESGVLAPHLGGDPEGHHYSHMGRVRPVKSGEFRELTKTPEFKKGISHDDMYSALAHHRSMASGFSAAHIPLDRIKHLTKVQEHPFVEKMQDFVVNTGTHPADMTPRNMGVWEHPHTGQRHLVVADYGATDQVMKHYQQCRMNMAAKRW